MISKTRGTGMRTTEYGPRGQRQNFRSDTDPTDDMYRNFIPAPNCFGNCPNPQGIYQPAGQGANLRTGQPMGVQCPASHPNSQMPNCAPPQPPTNPPGITTTFISNINNGYNQFGCSFLYNRQAHLVSKLQQLVSAGTNPRWRQMLQNRISYLNGLALQNCTGGPTPPPPAPPVPPRPKPVPQPNQQWGGTAQPMMNASGGVRPYFPPLNDRQSGDSRSRISDEQIVRVAQVVGTWMN